MHNIRRIESSEESERKRKRNTLILSIVMIGILVFSTAGYFSMREDSGDSSSEGVQNTGNGWLFKYGDQQIMVDSSLDDAKNVSVILFKRVDDYYGKTVYVASDYDAEFYEIYQSLGKYTGRMQQACYGDCEKDLPEKNCNDTLIVVKRTNESETGKVYEKDNCVFIEGDMKAVDAFIYKVFEVL